MKVKKVVVFDLDDTLIYELDYLKSAYHEIVVKLKGSDWQPLWNEMLDWYSQGANVFDLLVERFPSTTKEDLLYVYRNHIPKMNLNDYALEVLQFCKDRGYVLGLISDGRSFSQRNKLRATGIIDYFDKIIISEEFGTEKPCIDNYKVFCEFESESYYYIADNPKKDFLAPEKLGWTTVCLKNKGFNIHQQHFDWPKEYLPKICIDSLKELIAIIEC